MDRNEVFRNVLFAIFVVGLIAMTVYYMLDLFRVSSYESEAAEAAAEDYARSIAEYDFGDDGKTGDYCNSVLGTIVSINGRTAKVEVENGAAAKAEIHKDLSGVSYFIGKTAEIGFTEYENGMVYITLLREGKEVTMTYALQEARASQRDGVARQRANEPLHVEFGTE
jgi:hypothetical protein